MGELINLAAWKKRKEDEAHEKEMEEIRLLREELSEYIAGMEAIEPGPYVSEAERDSWSKRAIDVFSTVLDGYSHWPIDSSDM